MGKAGEYIVGFEKIRRGDIGRVGGKNASLGEMIHELASKGIRVPSGFAVTVEAYRHFITVNSLQGRLKQILKGLNTSDVESLRQRAELCREAILNSSMPDDLHDEIVKAYRQLSEPQGRSVDVAVRSSATAEDLPEASFAGQQETYLNVNGDAQVVEMCKKCFSSLFTDRAIVYRANIGFDHLAVSLSVGVQRMVRSDLASAGVMFSIDTETGFRDVVLINASYGLGESVVQGTVSPDEYYVFKPTLKQGYRPVIERIRGSKESKVVYDIGGGRGTRTIPVSAEERASYVLNDDDILALARWAVLIEESFSRNAGRPVPMDIEWAKDGLSGELFVVQARPETVQVRRPPEALETFVLKERGRVLLEGRSVGMRITSGRVRVIKDLQDLNLLEAGEILVTERTDPDWEPVMKKSSGIITDRGGRTCHAAIVARELGVPAVVGTGNATEVLNDNQSVTISCAQGETGFVYDGSLKYEIKRTDIRTRKRPRTKIMMNIADPAEAFNLSFLPNDGIGLAREEFIIGHHVKIHPMALVHFDELQDRAVRKQISEMTIGYSDKTRYFVDKLAEGVGMIAAAFYPKDVIIRLSDFKTNEYASLIGGGTFEPSEENPMIGFRGASRYYHPRYQQGFALECLGIKKVRDEMGLKNLKVMIPFCRTLEEGRRVIREMAKHGLERGKDGLEVYVMCEIPSNVILANEFAEIFDGFSIGSNDLTQLILGVDRDSEIIAGLFDERNQAVIAMIAQVISAAKRKGRKIGICGQAPSDYPEFAAFLVRQGIDSISLNPDALLATTQRVLKTEEEFSHAKLNGEDHGL